MKDMYGDSPVHPLNKQAHDWDIIRFDYHVSTRDNEDAYLDLILRKDDKTRKLRFIRPRNLKIEEGFPHPTRGMIILDIRHKQWQDTGVEVTDFEASFGAITFYAKDVHEID